jgi:hypothetical protein
MNVLRTVQVRPHTILQQFRVLKSGEEIERGWCYLGSGGMRLIYTGKFSEGYVAAAGLLILN